MFKKLLSGVCIGICTLLFSLSVLTPVVEKPKYPKLEKVQVWAKKQKYLIPNENDLHMAFSAGAQNNVDPLLILAVIGVESSFKPTVKSNAGAIGYMQVVPKWHLNKISDVSKLNDPWYNVHIGSAILGELLDKTNSLEKALQRYNGSNNNKYSNKVLQVYKRLLEELNANE